ncbi:hypothetical protein, partial [Intestinimonas sp. RTP31139st1_F5_RTP31139_211217]|uniref:hypothetical protein n=1 Tax=Intestinimonas sp. RTP31139st1_F5_RTP31139_211217 TaxID=3143190 RepID=UPI0032ED5856
QYSNTENKKKASQPRPAFFIPISRAIQLNALYHQNQNGNNKSPFQRPESEYATSRRTESSQYPSL